MRLFLSALPLLAMGCTEQEFSFQNNPPPIGDLALRGRVCHPTTKVWLENALVYTHLYDDKDVVYDSRTDYTDEDGNYELTGLVADKDYEVYVQIGHDIIDKFLLTLQRDDVVVPAGDCFSQVAFDVAVISGAYDDLVPVLESIGVAGPRVINGQVSNEIIDFLTDPAALNSFDMVFFDGGHREDGVIYGTGPVAEVHDALRSYVANGGVVFASDWAYDVVEQVWPDRIDFYGDDTVPDAAQIGEFGTVSADVVDAPLASAIGQDRVVITYDLPVWPLVVDVGSGVNVLLRGDAPWRKGLDTGTLADVPLLVSFAEGNGRVVFTTYRNAVHTDTAMLDLLAALVDP